MAVCKLCGKEFIAGRGSKGIYCSRKCNGTASIKERHEEARRRAFIKTVNKMAAKEKAAIEKNRQDFIKAAKRLKLCMECGELFVSHRGSIYCSDNCRSRRENRLSEERKRFAVQPDADYSITLLKLLKRSGGKCNCCGKDLDIKTDPCSKDYPTIDHIIPVSKGGAHKWSNVQLLCRGCNSRKFNK